jgi:peroxiredoxin
MDGEAQENGRAEGERTNSQVGAAPPGDGGNRQPRGRGKARLILAAAGFALVAIIAVLLLDTRSTSAPAAAGGIRGSSVASARVGAEIGDRAPDFALRDLHGNQVSLHGFLGKPVLLHFWAVDCDYCRAEQPDYLQAIHNLGAHAPKILAIDAWGESRGYVAPYVTRTHLPGTVLIDPPHTVFDSLYKGQGTPTTVYIDKQGIIRQTVIGPESRDQIVANAKLIGA